MLLEQKNLNCKPCMFSKASALLSMVFLTVLVLTACSPTADVTVGKPQLNSDGSQSEWVPVTSKRGHFTVLMPGIPKESTYILAMPDGAHPVYLFSTAAPSIVFTMAYFDTSQIDFSYLPRIREKIRDDIIADDGKLISEREITTAGREATEILFEKQNGHFRMLWRFYPGKPNTHIASVVMPTKMFVSPIHPNDSLIASNFMARFFDSVKFQK